MITIFISYAKPDEEWAEWIASQLDLAGYEVIIGSWDFLPGQNFVIEMQKALVRSEYVLAVLSENYLKGRFTHSEWTTAFASDPLGEDSRLIPVKISDCEVDGILGQIISIDIAGYFEDKACELLLRGVRSVIGGFRGRYADKLPLPEDLVKQIGKSHGTARGRNVVRRVQEDLKKSILPNLEAIKRASNYPGIHLKSELAEKMDRQAGDAFLQVGIEKYISEILGNLKTGKMSIILIDIDDLTKISKKYGAQIGSKVLIRVLEIIGEHSQRMKYGRCGDDTFYIMLPDYRTNKALQFARKLCKSVIKHNWSAVEAGLKVTISAGVARLKSSEPAIDFVVRAANGFIWAKKNGGNRAELGPILLELADTRILRELYS